MVNGDIMKQGYFIVVASLLAGFLGGVAGSATFFAYERSHPRETVRARSFEVVDAAGRTISYWGVDNGQNAVIAFANRGEPGGVVLPGQPPPNLRDPDKQLLAVGLQGNDMPMIKMRGADGKTRVRMYLSEYSKPLLLMEDETGPRVLLGVDGSDTPSPEDNNWTLMFMPERAWIGMGTEKVNGTNYIVSSFFVSHDRVKSPESK
jgi:hypothetical protein